MRTVYVLIALAGAALLLWQPEMVRDVAFFVVTSIFHVTPIVIPGVVLTAWIMASGAGGQVAAVFNGKTAWTVLASSVVGALLPVCGVTVLPLMAGLLAGGVPLAPVMAFWLSSPITGPALLSATVATLGWSFAIGKMLAAIGLGIFGGAVTGVFAGRAWNRSPLRTNRLVGSFGEAGGCGSPVPFDPLIWRDRERVARFVRSLWSTTRFMLLVLTPAFAAEFLLNAWLQPDALVAYVGRGSVFAVPLAVIVGAPAYVDGYAALPLTRALMEHGMSSAAAMAFLVSGGVVSIWGAMAIFPVLKLKPFLLYLFLAASGSMASGWLFGFLQ
ncbi:MAG: permease [Rhodobiaceae bacterium]|nr:permease [Rhodobiaceae bacterium]MCC0060275.1 permease [Rhodobiaceae bacterium]